MDLEARVERTCAAVGRLDAAAMAAARGRLDNLTKPPHSLGRLEEVVVRLAGMQAQALPDVHPGTVVVAAADHGVAAQGVSAYPAEVTLQMVRNFLAGGAAVNALARQASLRVRVVDVGVAGDVADPPGDASGAPQRDGAADTPAASRVPGTLDVRKVRRGTADFTQGPAMTRDEALATVCTGIELAEEEAGRGTRLLVPGEMGIGNTTAASALLVGLAGVPVQEAVGRGTGVDDRTLARKREVVRAALERNPFDPTDPWDALARLGGLDIACLAGLILGAAARRLPVLLDGFIVSAAALVAVRAEPRASAYLMAAHRSAEAGHATLLRLLGLQPLLALGMRLGEGSGAAATAPLLAAACAFMRQMATFDEAGVAGGGAAAGGGPERGSEPLTAALGVPPAAAPNAGVPPPPHRPTGGAAPHALPPPERDGVYRAVFERRDMRTFRGDPLPEDLVVRLLRAAHCAPSVGFMQPWRFILVRDGGTKAALKALVERERQAQALHFEGRRADLFPRLKVDGIGEAPLVICVCVDPTRGGPHVLGRHSEPATDVYSAACAVQNLWLAARAEGVGVGWVTFYRKPDLRQVLAIPPHVDPIALLCVGYVHAFPPRPVLEAVGWERRLPLAAVVREERWDGATPGWAERPGPEPTGTASSAQAGATGPEV